MDPTQPQNRKKRISQKKIILKYLTMKHIIYALLILILTFITSCSSSKTASAEEMKTKVEVRGNCEMCEETIENAALSVNGVQSAEWNQEQELLTVIFNSQQTNLEAIETAIAAKGYDTQHKTGDISAYKNLPGCCVYDHKKQ